MRVHDCPSLGAADRPQRSGLIGAWASATPKGLTPIKPEKIFREFQRSQEVLQPFDPKELQAFSWVRKLCSSVRPHAHFADRALSRARPLLHELLQPPHALIVLDYVVAALRRAGMPNRRVRLLPNRLAKHAVNTRRQDAGKQGRSGSGRVLGRQPAVVGENTTERGGGKQGGEQRHQVMGVLGEEPRDARVLAFS